MERDIKHFEDRLDKDTYSKDEVSKLLLNEATFTEQKVKKGFEGYVSAEEHTSLQNRFNELETSSNDSTAKLNEYVKKEFNGNVESTLGGLNGLAERKDDFIKLGGLVGTEDVETIKTKAMEMKESGNYNFLFKNENSGGATQTQHGVDTPKTKIENFAPKQGILDKIFKK